MTASLLEPPLLARLKQHERILIVGAGGGFDVYALMAIYFGFELGAVARRSLYLDLLEGTESIFEVSARIEAFRNNVAAPRPRRVIPH